MALSGLVGAIGGGGTVGRAVVEVVGDSSRLRADLEKAKVTTATSTKTMGAQTTGFAKYAQGAYLLAGAAVVGFVAAGVKAAVELEKVNAQTAAGIKSTGGAANVTAEQVRAMAERLEELSSIDEITIQQGENLLLTFTNIRNEVGKGNQVFDRATLAALDLSARGFGAMESTSKMLGKALQDPVRGLTALGRAGVQFTAQQKEQIKVLVESGKMLEAQKIILAEVEKQVGGSAEALGKTTAGQWRLFIDAIQDSARSIAQELMPALAGLARGATDVVQFLSPIIGILGDIIGAVTSLPGGLATLIGAFLGFKLLSFVPGLLVSIGAALQGLKLVAVGGAVGNFGIALAGLIPIVGQVGLAIGALLLAGEGLQGLVNKLTDTVSTEQALATATTQLQQAVASGKFTWAEIQGAVDEYNRTIGALPGAEKLTMAAIRGTVGAATDLAGAYEEGASAAEDLLSAQLALAGGFVGIASALDSAADGERALAEARKEVARLTREGKTGTEEYAAAVEVLDDAARGSLQNQLNLAGAVEKFAEEAAASGDVQGAIDRVKDFGKKAGLTSGEINTLVGQVKDAITEIGNLPGAKKIDFSTPGLSGMVNDVQRLKDKLAAIPSTVTTRFVISGDEVNPRPGAPGGTPPPGGKGNALGGIIAGASGFITRGPTMLVGESRKMTFAGRGAEAVIPFDQRGIGILAKALEKAGGQTASVDAGNYLAIHFNAPIYGMRDFRRQVERALEEASARFGMV